MDGLVFRFFYPHLFCVVLLGLLLGGAQLAAQQTVPASVLPLYSGGATDGFFIVELMGGATTYFDRLKRDPLEPRTQGSDNFFQMIGRPTEAPAKVGEILFGPILTNFGSVRSAIFVESSTGYVAFFEQPNKGKFGKLTNAMGRPFGPLANPDGNFALLMRRDGSGGTEGAYLYHATTGKALFLSEVDKLATEPVMFTTDALPQLAGPVASVALHNDNQETYGYLLLDGGSGQVHFVGLVAGAPGSFNVRLLDLNLKQAFGSPEAPAELGHLTAVGLQNSAEATSQILLVEPNSGAFATLDLASLPGAVTFAKSSRDIYAGRGGDSTAGRYFTPIPYHDGDGQTLGVYLWDSATRSLLYLANPTSLNTLAPRIARRGG